MPDGVVCTGGESRTLPTVRTGREGIYIFNKVRA